MNTSLRLGRGSWRILLFSVLLLLLSLAGTAKAQISVNLQFAQYDSDEAGIYYIIWISTSTTNPQISSVNVISADGAFGGGLFGPEFWTTPIGLEGIVNSATNGLWTMDVVSNGVEQTNFFSVNVDDNFTNDFPPLQVLYPASYGSQVLPDPTISWTGPTNFADLAVYVQDTNGDTLDSADLSLVATNWVPANYLEYGTKLFNVTYTNIPPDPDVTFSIPTNTAGMPLAGWSGSAELTVSQTTHFFVGTPPPLVAHYTFDNTNYVTQDTSGNGFDLQGPNWFNIPPNSVSNGVVGAAVQFFGGAWFYMQTNLLSTLGNSFSVSVWLQTTNSSGNDTDPGTSDIGILWTDAPDNTNNCIPLAQNGDVLGFYTGDANQDTLHSSNSIDTGHWVHLVVTRDMLTGQKAVYLNGVLNQTDIGGTNSLEDSTQILLGLGFTGNFTGYVGLMDDLQIYNAVLGPQQVSYLYGNPESVLTNIANSELAVGAGDTNAAWISSGDNLWFQETTNTSGANVALQSGETTYDQTSTLQTTLTGPGTLNFEWQSVANDSDFNLEFDLDGSNYFNIYGITPWTSVGPLSLSAGPHTLTWTASADGATNPADAGFLDQVSFSVVTGNPVITLNPFNQTNYPGYPVWLSANATGTPAPAWQWYQAGSGAIAGATSNYFVPTNSGTTGVAGSYYAVASNSLGTATTLTAAVTFVSAPLPPGWSIAVRSPYQTGNDPNIVRDYYAGCAVDSAGDVYVADQYTGDATVFAGGESMNTLTAAGADGAAALVKYSSSGSVDWAVGLTNNDPDSYSFALCVAAAPGNGAYLLSDTVGTNWLGTNRFANNGNFSILLSRFDVNGSNVWSKSIGLTNIVLTDYNDLVSDASGNVTIAGLLAGTADFGGTNLTPPSGFGGFIAQYNSNGVVRWAQTLPGFPQNMAEGGGQIYVSFSSTTVGGLTNIIIGSLSNLTDRAYGFAGLNASTGQALWQHGVGEQFGSKTADFSDDIPLISISGQDVFLTGSAYGDSAVFGGLTVPVTGGYSQYFARYDTTGNVQVATNCGGPTTLPWAVAADSSGVYISGDFDYSSYFGNYLIAAPEYAPSYLGAGYFTQPFVAKFDRNGNALWALNGVSSLLANFRGIATSSDGVWASGITYVASLTEPAYFGTHAVIGDGYFSSFGSEFIPTQGGLLTKITETAAASPVTLLNPKIVGTNFQFQFLSQSSISYNILYRTNLASGAWLTNASVTGNGAVLTNTIPLSVFSSAKAGFVSVSAP